LLVTGAGGGVGGAVAQIGKWRGARVIGVDRGQLPDDSPAAGVVEDFFVLGDEPLESLVRRATNGRGAEVVFDTVGGPLFEPTLKFLAHGGRQLEITSVGEVASGSLLEALTPVFEQGTFKAPKIDRIISLSEGPTAYEQVARGEARGRLVLSP
jgi:NADPH2:quinone reductase